MSGEPGAARVLWMTEEVPGRELGGGSIRQAHLFEAVASEVATDLWVVGHVGDEAVRKAAATIVELPKGRPLWTENTLGRRLLQVALALGSRLPGQIHFARPGRRALAKRLRSGRDEYDLVIVQHEALAPLSPRDRRAPWVIDLHHLVSAMAEHEGSLARRFWQRWLLAGDARKARALERRILRSFDRVLVCSEDDAAALCGPDGGARRRVTVIPNGVDLSRFAATDLPAGHRILFPGTLGYLPNVDGATWFCNEVLPAIRAAVPDAEVELVGRDPVPEVLELATLPGVSVHADVPSMVPYLERARMVVVPLRIGTGTRLKALEAMASGRPVVGTTVGLQGIGAVDRQNALVADRPESLAAAAVELLTDNGLGSRLAEAARAHVEGSYGWDAITERMLAVVTDLLHGRRR
jgi:glycosyltransferase involved in cell wall biosynthesis